jgi:hypothetical protein
MAEDVVERLREGRTNLEELIRMLPYRSVYQFRELSPSWLLGARAASREDVKRGPLRHPEVKTVAGAG